MKFILSFTWLVGLSILAKRFGGSVLFPGAVFNYFWTFLCFLAAISPLSVCLTPLVLLWFVISVSIFTIGAMCGTSIYPKNRFYSHHKIYYLSITTDFFTFLGILHVLVVLFDAGIHMASLLNYDGIRRAAVYFSSGRYLGTYQEPFRAMLLLPCVYIAPLLGGVQAVNSKKTFLQKMRPYSSILPSICIALFKGEKFPLYLSICFFYSTYFSFTLAVKNERIPPIKKLATKIIPVAILIILVNFISMMARDNVVAFSRDGINTTINRLASYGGSIYGFGLWLENNKLTLNKNLALGKYTFAGPLHLFGFYRREQGLYIDNVQLPNGQLSNLYTCFRPLVEDFSPIGALLFLYLLGLLGGYAYASSKNGSIIGAIFLSFVYIFTLVGYNTSFFVHNSPVIAFLFFSVAIFFSAFLPAFPWRSFRLFRGRQVTTGRQREGD